MSNSSIETKVTMLNGIRDVASDEYKNAVPIATKDNLRAVGNPIVTYQAFMNEFLTLFVNRIGMPIVRARSFRNPLAILKREGDPLGTDEQEYYVNPASGKDYNARSTDLLAQTDPEVKVAYHRINRQRRFAATIQFAVIRGAFLEWSGLDRLTDEVVKSLYNGNYIEEYQATKNIIVAGIADNTMPIIETTTPTDEASGKAFMKTVKKIFGDFAFPRTQYNAWNLLVPNDPKPLVTYSNLTDIIFFVRNDINAEIDVEVLAKAYNLDKTNFVGKVIPVDNFGVGFENVLAVMCDKEYPVILDKLNIIEDFRNGSNLSVNYWLHVWQTISTSPLVNAVAFVDPKVDVTKPDEPADPVDPVTPSDNNNT